MHTTNIYNFSFKQLQSPKNIIIIVPLEHFSTSFRFNLCAVNFCRHMQMQMQMRLSHLSRSFCILSILYSSISFYRFVILCSGLGRFFFQLLNEKALFEFSSSGIVYILLFSVLLKCLLKKYCFNYWKFKKAKFSMREKNRDRAEFLLLFFQYRWINNKWITSLFSLPCTYCAIYAICFDVVHHIAVTRCCKF